MVAPINPIFTWQDGKLRSPQEVSREREIAEALMFAKPQATGLFGALGQIGSALSGSLLDSRADAYAEQGREAASNLFAGIGSGSSADAISAALLNPAAEWATPAQSGIAEALFNNEIRQSDPAYQLDLAYKQAQLDALRNPQPVTLDPTSAMQNYQFLVGQGVDPSQAQTLAFGGGGTTINNMGNIPAGYEVFQDPATGATQMRAIPGGPADLEQQALAAEQAAAAEAGANAQTQTERYGNVVTEDIGRALDVIEKDPTFTTGVMGQILSNIGGTPANRVKNLVETVKSNVGFDRLQAMRESSPTGGALGSVTERELSLLTSAIGSLEQSNNSEDLAYNLRRVNKIYMDIIHGPGNWEQQTSSPTTRKTSTGVEFSF